MSRQIFVAFILEVLHITGSDSMYIFLWQTQSQWCFFVAIVDVFPHLWRASPEVILGWQRTLGWPSASDQDFLVLDSHPNSLYVYLYYEWLDLLVVHLWSKSPEARMAWTRQSYLSNSSNLKSPLALEKALEKVLEEAVIRLLSECYS